MGCTNRHISPRDVYIMTLPVTPTSVKHLSSILSWRLSHLEAVFVESLAHFETETVAAAAAVAFFEAVEKSHLKDICKSYRHVFISQWKMDRKKRNLNCFYSILANRRKQKDLFLWNNKYQTQSMSRN